MIILIGVCVRTLAFGSFTTESSYELRTECTIPLFKTGKPCYEPISLSFLPPYYRNPHVPTIWDMNMFLIASYLTLQMEVFYVQVVNLS